LSSRVQGKGAQPSQSDARARNGAAGALEEGARLTALFLWTHQSTSTNGADNSEVDVTCDSSNDAADDEDEDSGAKAKSPKGLTLIFDVVRRFSQPLGIHLNSWEGRIVETKKSIVRLLPVKECAEQLLSEDGAVGAADMIERSRGSPLNYKFAFMREGDSRPALRRRTSAKKTRRVSSDEDDRLSSLSLEFLHLPGARLSNRQHR
jgi:hypothetical protein